MAIYEGMFPMFEEPLTSKKLIGEVSQEQIERVSYSHRAGPIFIGQANVKHMKQEHGADFDAYGEEIPTILKSPDFIGVNPNDGSLQFIKKYDQNVLVAVRITGSGTLYYARSLYHITEDKFNDYITAGRLFPCHPKE